MATKHDVPVLGRLSAVPIREVWSSEPYAFDPWLSQPENLQFLAEALGLPGLELLVAQSPVGPFYADLICQVVGTEHKVVIENQLDKADHRHLGQVLTYAPHHDARICVWVAAEICDEHRAAVDWLNRITGEGYAFFGVEVKAVRIGDSLPAPLFDVVAKPNEWAKITPFGQTAQDGEASSSNISYWSQFHEKLSAAEGPLRKVSTDLKNATYWAPILGGGRAYIWAYRSWSKKPYVFAGLSIYNQGAAMIWDELTAQRETCDMEFGENLDWIANSKHTAFHLQTEKFYSELDPMNWQQQHQFLIEKMVKLNNVFAARVQAINDGLGL